MPITDAAAAHGALSLSYRFNLMPAHANTISARLRYREYPLLDGAYATAHEPPMSGAG